MTKTEELMQNSDTMRMIKMGNPDLMKDYNLPKLDIGLFDIERMVKNPMEKAIYESPDPDGAIANFDTAMALNDLGIDMESAHEMAQNGFASSITGIDTDDKSFGEAAGITAQQAIWQSMKGTNTSLYMITGDYKFMQNAKDYNDKIYKNPIRQEYGELGDMVLSGIQPTMSMAGFIMTAALVSWLPAGMAAKFGGAALKALAAGGKIATPALLTLGAGYSQSGDVLYNVMQTKDIDGKPLPWDTTTGQTLFHALSLTMGLVEVGSMQLFPWYRQMNSYFTKGELAKQLEKGLAAGLKNFFWEGGKGTAGESIEEGVQTGLSLGYENILRAMAKKKGAKFEQISIGDIAQQMGNDTWEAGKSMLLSSFLMAGIGQTAYGIKQKVKSSQNFNTTKESYTIDKSFINTRKDEDTSQIDEPNKDQQEAKTPPAKIDPIKVVQHGSRVIPINAAEMDKASEASARGAQVIEVEVNDDVPFNTESQTKLAHQAAISTEGKIVDDQTVAYETQEDLNYAMHMLATNIEAVEKTDGGAKLTLRNEDGTLSSLDLVVAEEGMETSEPDISFVEDPEAPYALSRMKEERAYQWHERQLVKDALGGIIEHTGGRMSSADLEANVDAVILVAESLGIPTDELLKNNVAFELVGDLQTTEGKEAHAKIEYQRDDGGNKVYTISLDKTANVGSLVHEVGHLLRGLASKDQLQDFVDHYGDGKTAIWLDDIVKDSEGKFELNGKTYETFAEAAKQVNKYEERFANDFVTYLRTGEAPTTALKNVFNRMKTVLKKLIGTYGYKLDPQTIRAFDQLFAESEMGVDRETRTEGGTVDSTGNALFEPAPPVDSKKFKAWFGDSKVVDENGNPKVVYHGTRNNFTEFTPTRGQWGVGISFSNLPSYAGGFASMSRMGEVDSYPNVMPVYLSMENPYVVGKSLDAPDAKKLKKQGYDGLISENMGADGKLYIEYVAFSPTQIKSATGNNGAFSNDNPSILFQEAAPIDSQEFKTWFKESQVKDSNGNPKVMYHGSKNEFGNFARQITSYGYFFTPDKNTAVFYGDKVYEVYISAQNTIDLNDSEKLLEVIKEAYGTNEYNPENFGDYLAEIYFEHEEFSQLSDLWELDTDEEKQSKIDEALSMVEKADDYDSISQDKYFFENGLDKNGVYAINSYGTQQFYSDHQDNILHAAESLGYDGVSMSDPSSTGRSESFVVFSPTQVKSINNQGTWDDSNPNILFEEDGKVALNTDYPKQPTYDEMEKIWDADETNKGKIFFGNVSKFLRKWEDELRQWLEGKPDILQFGDEQIVHVIHKNVIPDEGPWRSTTFINRHDEWIPWGHTAYDTKYEAVRENVGSKNYRPDILFELAPPVDSKAFEDFYKDASLVNKDGSPISLYHGTDRQFDTFDKNAKSKTGHPSSVLGHFLTTNKDVARGFSRDNSKATFGFANTPDNIVMEVYTNIQNPKILTRMKFTNELSVSKTSTEEYGFMRTPEGWGEYKQELVNEGYDGIIIQKDTKYSVADEFKADNIIVFDSANIQVVDASRGNALYEEAMTIDWDQITETAENKVLDTPEKIAAHNTVVEIKEILFDNGRLNDVMTDQLSKLEKILLAEEDIPKYFEIEEYLTKIGDKRWETEIYEDHLLLDDGEINEFDPDADIFDLAIQEKGLTDDIYEAGYILPDGTMLDLSGKRDGGPAGKRSEDHRQLYLPINEDLSGSETMIAFQKMGAVRIDANSGLIDMETRPTYSQHKVIKDLIIMNDEAYVDLQDGNRKASFRTVGDPDRAISNIMRFYNGQELRASELFELAPPEGEKRDAWFGRSVVIDKWGEPLSVYHGSAEPFTMFKNIFKGFNTGADSAKLGWYFTANKDVAATYAIHSAPKEMQSIRSRLNVVESELRAEGINFNKMDVDENNPLVIDREALLDKWDDLDWDWMQNNTSAIMEVNLIMKNPLTIDRMGEGWNDSDYEKALARAVKNGNDGVIFKNARDSMNDAKLSSDQYIVFDDSQVGVVQYYSVDDHYETPIEFGSDGVLYEQVEDKKALDERVGEQDIDEVLETMEVVKDAGGLVDQYGYVTVYHRTSRASAEEIRKTGVMIAEEDGLFFSTERDGQAIGYGESVVKLEIPIEHLEMDDLFDKEVHFRLPLKRMWKKTIDRYSPTYETKETTNEPMPSTPIAVQEETSLYELSDEAKEQLLEWRKKDVRTAVEQFYWIADEILQEYIGEDWADNEIRFRQHLKEFPWALDTAREFADADDFLEHLQTSTEMGDYQWALEDDQWFRRIHAYSRIMSPVMRDAQFVRIHTSSHEKLVELGQRLKGYEDVASVPRPKSSKGPRKFVTFKWGSFKGVSTHLKRLKMDSSDADFEKVATLIQENPRPYRQAIQVVEQAEARVLEMKGLAHRTDASREAYYDSLSEEMLEILNEPLSLNEMSDREAAEHLRTTGDSTERYDARDRLATHEGVLAMEQQANAELKALGAEKDADINKTGKKLQKAQTKLDETNEGFKTAKSELRKTKTKLKNAKAKLAEQSEKLKVKSAQATEVNQLTKDLADRRARVKELRTTLTEQNESVRKLTKTRDSLQRRLDAKRTRETIEKLHKRIMRTIRFNPASIDASFESTFKILNDLLNLNQKAGGMEQLPQQMIQYLSEGMLPYIQQGRSIAKWTIEDLEILLEAAKLMRLDAQTMINQKKNSRTEKLQNLALEMYRQTYGMMPDISEGDQSVMNDIIDELLTKQDQYDDNVFKAMFNTVKASIGKMQRIARVLDGNKEGVMYNLLVREAYIHMTEEIRESFRRLEEADKKMKALGITPEILAEKTFKFTAKNGQERILTKSKVIGVYVYSQNPLGMAKLVHNRGNQLSTTDVTRAIGSLTEKEKAWGDFMIDSLGSDESWERQRDVFYNVYNQNLGKRDRYFTFVTEGKLMEEGKTDILSGPYNQRVRYTEKDFTKLVNPNAVYPLKLDVTSTYGSMVKKQEHFIQWAEWTRDMNHLLTKGAIGRMITMKHGPKFYSAVEAYVRDVGSPQTLMDDIERLGSKIVSNAAVAALSLNVLTMLKQLPSFTAALRGDVGAVELLQVSMRLTNPKTHAEAIKFIHEMSPYMRKRAISVEVQRYNATDFNTYAGRMVSKFNDKIGMKGIYFMDQAAVNTLWLAAYDTYLRRNPMKLEGEALKTEAAFKATQLISETQPTSIITDLASVQTKKNPWVRAGLLFTNQMFQYVNMVWYDMPSSMKAFKATHDKVHLQRMFGIIMNMAVSGALIILVSGAAFRKDGEDDEEWWKRIMKEVAISTSRYTIPIIGNAVSQGASGYSMGSIVDLPSAFGRLLGTDWTDPDKISDRIWDLAEAGASGVALPTAFTNRVIKSIDKKNPLDMFGSNWGDLWERWVE